MNGGHITMGTQYLGRNSSKIAMEVRITWFQTQQRDARFRLFWADFEKIGENRNPEKR
jgi:hypothetical protein